jgi:hypothetical protein
LASQNTKELFIEKLIRSSRFKVQGLMNDKEIVVPDNLEPATWSLK